MSRVSCLLTVGRPAWPAKYLASVRRLPSSPSSALWSIPPAPIFPAPVRSGVRSITRTASRPPIATVPTSSVTLHSRTTRRLVVLNPLNPVSHRFESTSSPSKEASINPSDALIQQNIKSVQAAFTQLPADPLSFLQASPVTFLQTLRLRPLRGQVVYDHIVKVLRTYTQKVVIYKEALSPELKTQLHESYVVYRDFWEGILRDPGIPTVTREEMNRVVRVCQLNLLGETEDWKEACLLIEKLQNEAREERMAQPGGKAEDDGKKANMAVHHSYEKPLRDIAGRYVECLRERLRKRQVEPQSALRFLLPILSSLASSSSPDQIAIASSLLSRLYGIAYEQLTCPAIESDPDLKVSQAGSKDNDPISTFAATVLALVDEFPQLSSQKTLLLLAVAYERKSVLAGPSQMGLLADLIVRESLSLNSGTVKMIVTMASILPTQVAIRFMDHLNSRRIDTNAVAWQDSASRSIRSPCKPVCPERVVRLYELVPEEHRSRFEEHVLKAFDKKSSKLGKTPVFTRQEVRAAFRTHGVDEGAIERMCGSELDVIAVEGD